MRYLSLVLWLVRWPALSSDTGAIAPPQAKLAAETRVISSESIPPAAPVAGPALPSLGKESATYKVSFGIFGEVARATLALSPGAATAPGQPAGGPIMRLVGSGDGAVLGLARTEKRIESEFDLASLAARRWTAVRISGGTTTVDGAVQATSGALALLRKRTGQPDLPESFSRSAAVLDPLSFLLRLRLALPTATTIYEVLDGRALWLAEVSAARPDADDPTLVRVDGHMDPVYWNGTTDPQRSRHDFALFFTRDRHHTPVRLVVPHAMGEFRADLVRLERPEAMGKHFLFAVSPGCRGQPGQAVCKALSALSALVVTSP